MKKYQSVVFYNHGHLGDSLLCKPFIKEIKKYIKAERYFISTEYDISYFSDVVDEFTPLNPIMGRDSWFVELENTIYINTWFGALHHKLRDLNLMDEYNNLWDEGILYNYPHYLFYFNTLIKMINPDVDLSYMNNNKFDYLMETPFINIEDIPFFDSNKIKILIFNQEVHSGQAESIDYSHLIASIANRDIIIYVSKKIGITGENIIQLPDYIEYPDLNKISSLSRVCNFICGPCNAPIITTWTKENLTDDSKTYITVNSHHKGEAIYFKETQCVTHVVRTVYELFDKLKIELDGKYV